MSIYIFDTKNKQYLETEIVEGKSTMMPLKKDGWQFNWRREFKKVGTTTYILRIKNKSDQIEGVLQLKQIEGMLIMDLIEIAAHNLGKKKKYDFVAGCLIAFSCRESIKLESSYRGFLTFIAKTQLIDLYKTKYGATQALGQRMYIDDIQGKKLISEYLERKIT